MEQHQVEYMKRNYPSDWQTREMTSYDAKMAHMVNKIREKYKQIYETRPHTILMEHKALIQQAPQPQVQKPPQKEEQAQKEAAQKEEAQPRVQKPVQKEAAQKEEQAICQAITITTNKVCGRKAKNGGFCGLHCKKV